MTKQALCLALLSALLSACGGSSAPPAQTANASPGGIWSGVDSVSALTVLGIIDESGDAHFIRADGGQFVGTAVTSGGQLSGTYEAFAPLGFAFPDGATHGTGTVTGTVVARTSIMSTTQFRTDRGSTSNGTLNLAFNTLYNRPSSLQTLSGNFVNPSNGVVVSITSAGAIFYQDPNTGCVLNATASIINAAYNAYRIDGGFSNCNAGVGLSGSHFTGLGTLDNTASPERLVIGVYSTRVTSSYALVLSLNRI